MDQNIKGKSVMRLTASAGTRVLISLFAGIVGGLIIGKFISWIYSPLAAWDIAALIFLSWIYLSLHNSSPLETEELAKKEDPSHAVTDILLVLASVVSLVAVGVLIFQASGSAGLLKNLQIGLGLISVVISWFMVHTIYMLKYARLYYRQKGGIDFYTSVPPKYSDFAYIAFTIGMTFQISDNNFQTNEFRRFALRHALLSYLFGTIIVASLVNFLVSLGK